MNIRFLQRLRGLLPGNASTGGARAAQDTAKLVGAALLACVFLVVYVAGQKLVPSLGLGRMHLMLSFGFLDASISIYRSSLRPELFFALWLSAGVTMALVNRRWLVDGRKGLARLLVSSGLAACAATCLVFLYQMTSLTLLQVLQKLLRNNAELVPSASILVLMLLFILFSGMGEVVSGLKAELPLGVAVLFIAVVPFLAPGRPIHLHGELFALTSWCIAGAITGAGLERGFQLNRQVSPEHFTRQGFVGGAMAGFMTSMAPRIIPWPIHFSLYILVAGAFLGLFLTWSQPPSPDREGRDYPGDPVKQAIQEMSQQGQ